MQNLFEDISIYEALFSEKQYLEREVFPQFGIIIDGINDVQLFSNIIKEKIGSKSKIITISNELMLVYLEEKLYYFKNQINPELKLAHYNIYSIFLKKHMLNTIHTEFNSINNNLYYIYYDDNQFDSKGNNIFSQKAKDFKISSSYPKKFLYGFDNYSD